ncbi:MAG: ribonuclease, partial [Polaromonas sp.]
MVLALAAGLSGVIGFYPGIAQARSPLALTPVDTVSMAQLPPQGRSMLALVYQGGPFRHEKDGVV